MRKLAVLMPAYNAAAYLKESIDSVLNQTFANFDLYIYDDCSSDTTEALVLSYRNPRIFFRKNDSNLGIAKTLNKGLEELLPQYEYIARMDADDWCFPQRFEKQLRYMDDKPKVILCGTQGYWLKDMHQNPLKGWEYPTNAEYIRYYLLFAASFGHSSVIFRSQSIVDHALRYDETISTCEDWDLWTRIAQIGEMVNLPEFLMKYRILENSNHRSMEKMDQQMEERSNIIANYWNYFEISLSANEIFKLYYEEKRVSLEEFNSKIKKLTNAFNDIYRKSNVELCVQDRAMFSYLLARKTLSYWKRSQISRYNPLIWMKIVYEVRFMEKIKLLQSIIK